MRGANPIHAFFGYVKDQPCAACGEYATERDPVEVAHIRCLLSPKTGDTLPRSHRGLAAFSCLPLHRSEHEDLHRVGESAWLAGTIGHAHAFALVATLIANYYFLQEVEA